MNGDDSKRRDSADERESKTRDPLAWEPLDAETAKSYRGFDVVHNVVRLPDDTHTAFDFVHEPPAVVILPVTPEGRVVVIEEWREAVSRVARGLPAGTVEPDETLDAAARRELEEETGYKADSLESLTSLEASNGLTDSVHHHFVARGCRPTGDQDLDPDESIRVETTTLTDLLDALNAGELRDARSALGVLYYTRFFGE